MEKEDDENEEVGESEDTDGECDSGDDTNIEDDFGETDGLINFFTTTLQLRRVSCLRACKEYVSANRG